MCTRQLPTVLTLAVAVMVGVVAAEHAEDELVEELMEKTHEGKRSPYHRVKAQLEAPAVEWRLVEAAVPRFEAMSRALTDSKDDDIKGSADGYAAAVVEISTAVGNRDAKALRRGVESLSASCGDCHFKGGVGGDIED